MTLARRVLVLPPGTRRPYHPEEWRDALVSVDQGQIALETDGQRRAFHQGALLWLCDLALDAIHNPGPGPAVLTVTTRATTPRSPS